MDERKRRILLAVVQDYIATAEPIGSRTIARRYLSELSAATIRNEMADLEEMGYLEQPYTSAGRIPSDKGYRYYVDHLMDDQASEPVAAGESTPNDVKEEIAKLRLHYASGVRAMEEIVQETSSLLSSLTSYISLISTHGMQQSTFHRLQLVEMGDGQAVAVLVTDNGHVANRIIRVPAGADQSWLNYVSEYLSANLLGRPLHQLATDGMLEIRRQLAGRLRNYDQFCNLILDLLQEATPEKLYLGSTTQILTLPEFQDLGRMRSLLSFIEEDHRLQQLLVMDDIGSHAVQVRIGSENTVQEVEKLSLVSAPYRMHGRPLGYLGILGPTRMDYPRVLSIVREVSALLSETLERADS
ncbi:MAG: heat-inducible transcriptional repressor HrcA [Symbiobacteriaceae bacterium]|nr:heat-inducible transcriptional repressor HrcA [Symbiobacteriaceae bacterium]